MAKTLSWSYSSLTAFETCPRRYYLTRIAKEVTEPESEAIKWGNRVHKAMEDYLLQRTPMPAGMESYQGLADRILNKGGEVTAEQKLCLDSSFAPTSWFAKNAWVRGVVDVSVKVGSRMFVGDWKTGKPKPASDQLKLFAALTMAHQPEVEEVITAFVWMAQGRVTADRFTREDIPAIWQEFVPRVQRVEHAMQANKFPPRPSGLCRSWCPVGKKLCEHCGT